MSGWMLVSLWSDCSPVENERLQDVRLDAGQLVERPGRRLRQAVVPLQLRAQLERSATAVVQVTHRAQVPATDAGHAAGVKGWREE